MKGRQDSGSACWATALAAAASLLPTCKLKTGSVWYSAAASSPAAWQRYTGMLAAECGSCLAWVAVPQHGSSLVLPHAQASCKAPRTHPIRLAPCGPSSSKLT